MTTTTTTGTRGSGRRGGVTEQAADATVDQACRVLRPPTMRARFAEVADAADREQLTYRGFLAELLMAECDDRDRRRSARQITATGFSREKWLFQVLTGREETNSIAIASNGSCSGWTKTFTDPRLCASTVDRLTSGGNIIETGTRSCRLAHARTQRAGQATKRQQLSCEVNVGPGRRQLTAGRSEARR